MLQNKRFTTKPLGTSWEQSSLFPIITHRVLINTKIFLKFGMQYWTGSYRNFLLFLIISSYLSLCQLASCLLPLLAFKLFESKFSVYTTPDPSVGSINLLFYCRVLSKTCPLPNSGTRLEGILKIVTMICTVYTFGQL